MGSDAPVRKEGKINRNLDDAGKMEWHVSLVMRYKYTVSPLPGSAVFVKPSVRQDVFDTQGYSIGITAGHTGSMCSKAVFSTLVKLYLKPPGTCSESISRVYGLAGWLLRPSSWVSLR